MGVGHQTVRLDETLQTCDWKTLDIGPLAQARLTAPSIFRDALRGRLVWSILAPRPVAAPWGVAPGGGNAHLVM